MCGAMALRAKKHIEYAKQTLAGYSDSSDRFNQGMKDIFIEQTITFLESLIMSLEKMEKGEEIFTFLDALKAADQIQKNHIH